MSLEIRQIEASEHEAFMRAILAGFLHDSNPEHERTFSKVEDWSRAIAGFDDGELVATLGAFPLELAIPGATLPTAGTTHITVRPTHRRQGVLRELMSRHFEDVREREDPLAALWASESGIYSRFGYGPAAMLQRISIETRHSAFARHVEAPGRVRIVEAERAALLLPEIYEGLWRERAGHFARAREWWDNRVLLDAPWQREGMSSCRFAIYEEDGEARGYAQYRVRERWNTSGIPGGDLRVVEMQAEPAARAALWRLLLDVDLVERVTYWNVACDSELPWLLADPRRAERGGMRDALWLRLMDVPRALEARRYAVEDRVVIGVRDAQFEANAGHYLLDAGPAGAKCQRTSDAADLELDVADLAAVYLGGHSFHQLARAGRVHGDPTAILRADRMFHTPAAPWCPEIF